MDRLRSSNCDARCRFGTGRVLALIKRPATARGVAATRKDCERKHVSCSTADLFRLTAKLTQSLDRMLDNKKLSYKWSENDRGVLEIGRAHV